MVGGVLALGESSGAHHHVHQPDIRQDITSPHHYCTLQGQLCLEQHHRQQQPDTLQAKQAEQTFTGLVGSSRAPACGPGQRLGPLLKRMRMTASLRPVSHPAFQTATLHQLPDHSY